MKESHAQNASRRSHLRRETRGSRRGDSAQGDIKRAAQYVMSVSAAARAKNVEDDAMLQEEDEEDAAEEGEEEAMLQEECQDLVEDQDDAAGLASPQAYDAPSYTGASSSVGPAPFACTHDPHFVPTPPQAISLAGAPVPPVRCHH